MFEVKNDMEKSVKLLESEENLKKLFRENPDLKQAFKETIEELRKPENVEKMANEISTGIGIIKEFFENQNATREYIEKFMEKHGVEKYSELTLELKEKLGEELADVFIAKTKGGATNV